MSKSGANEVVLRDVQLHMAGKYRCEVSADAPSFHTSMVASYMHVVCEYSFHLLNNLQMSQENNDAFPNRRIKVDSTLFRRKDYNL